MSFYPKKIDERNRISYLSMPSMQNQKQRIKTQPIESSQFMSRINFKAQSKIPIRTSYVERNKTTQLVSIRKHKTNQRHSRYPSELAISQNHLTQRTKGETQRQKFIKELNSRVLLSKSISVIQEQNTKQEIKGRYEKQLSKSKLEKSAVKSRCSLGHFTQRDILEKPGRQSSHISVIKIKSVNGEFDEDDTELRDRAKTFAKDFSKIIGDNLNIRHKTCISDQEKTIQANNIEQIIRISQSHASNKIITKKTTPANLNIKGNQLNKSLPNQSVTGDMSNRALSSDRNDTQKYQEEVQQLTKEFLSDCDKMNATKKNLYQKLRNRLVKKFPNLRRKYKESELLPPQTYQNSKKQSLGLTTPGLQSSIKISFNNHNQNSDVNYLTVTQLRQQTQKMQRNQDKWKQQQKRTLKEIFLQAYFYSKTKARCFSVKFQKTDEEHQQKRRIHCIQKNMTFMKYINKKDNKLNISNAKKIRGDNIMRNKDSILQLEKEGSLKQNYLLKCLDDAIQNCLNR